MLERGDGKASLPESVPGSAQDSLSSEGEAVGLTANGFLPQLETQVEMFVEHLKQTPLSAISQFLLADQNLQTLA